MKKEKVKFKVGDSVVVKEGVMCPDYEGLSIAGWQGRVVEFYEEEGRPTVCFALDSIPLRSLPDEYVRQSEIDGLDWSQMGLFVDEVELTQPRDTAQDVKAAYDEIASRHYWDHLGEEGEGIQKVLAGVDPHDDWACMKAWGKYLKSALSFPFDAEVSELQEGGPLQAGDKVKVLGIGLVDDLYGVIVDVRLGRRKYALPLCDLEVVDKKSPNYQPVQDYCVWFANR